MTPEISYFPAFVALSAGFSLLMAGLVWACGFIRREPAPFPSLRRGVVSIGDEPEDLLGLPKGRETAREKLNIWRRGDK